MPRRSVVAAIGGVLVIAATSACNNVGSSPPAPPPHTGDQNGSLGSCSVFPPSNPWNADISSAPVAAGSNAYITQILGNGNQNLHPDFGGAGAYGIPYVTVPGTEPKVPVSFVGYPAESDPGPYPVPLGSPVEGGSDRHVIAVDRDACRLYEMYDATAQASSWQASNGSDWFITGASDTRWDNNDLHQLTTVPGSAFEAVDTGEALHTR